MVEMKDYLYNIAVLEGEILTQKNIQSTLRSQMAPLGQGRNYEKPIRPVWRIRDFFLLNPEHGFKWLSGIGALICIIFWGINFSLIWTQMQNY